MNKSNFPFEKKQYTYQEWGCMDFDWLNYYKVTYNVESYLWRYDNYLKGIDNHHILKSTFGKSNIEDIKKEIELWFNNCLGAYNTIEIWKV